MNLKLIFLILVLIVAITVFSVIYQTKLEDVSTEYKNKTEQFEKLTAQVVSEEAKVYEISELKEKAELDKETLESRYNELKNEKQGLEREKRVLQEELTSVKSELGQTKSELQDKITIFNLLQARFDQVEGSLIKANDEISRLASKVNNLCEQLQDTGGDDEGC
jgi:chromosome segregation ATPase